MPVPPGVSVSILNGTHAPTFKKDIRRRDLQGYDVRICLRLLSESEGRKSFYYGSTYINNMHVGVESTPREARCTYSTQMVHLVPPGIHWTYILWAAWNPRATPPASVKKASDCGGTSCSFRMAWRNQQAQQVACSRDV